MLQFTSDGFLTPPTIIPSSLDEFESYFAVDSPGNVRKRLFQSYVTYIEELKKFSGVKSLKQWIDGAFVTKKESPGDIDIINFIDSGIMVVNKDTLKKFLSPLSKTKYGLDCYFLSEYPENHPLYYSYMADRAYWINLFDKIKPDHRHSGGFKGFLEIIV